MVELHGRGGEVLEDEAALGEAVGRFRDRREALDG